MSAPHFFEIQVKTIRGQKNFVQTFPAGTKLNAVLMAVYDYLEDTKVVSAKVKHNNR